jgi:dipeptidyl aminopeptidase/acylaminoacyl peptidase
VDDAPEFDGAVRVRNGDIAYAIGTDRLAELQRYDRSSDTWVPLYDGISAEALEYSPDRHRVAYVTYPQRTLWVRQADGSRPIQLTSPPLVATFPRWSRDGRRIAFVGNESDKSARLYAVDAEGGPVKPVLEAATGSQGYPTWSPDGKELLYGTINSSTREEVYIRVANLESGKVTKLPGSEGLFAPRWSPDGMVLAALQWSDQRHLMLYRVKDKKWEEVKGRRVDWPSWDADSKSIFGRSGDSLIRYRLESGTFEVLTDIKPDEIGGFLHWIGLGLDGTPIRALNRDSRQVYALQVEPR